MSEKNQQKSCFKNGVSTTQTLEMLKMAFGDNFLSRADVFSWYKLFRGGRERVEDYERLGRQPGQRFSTQKSSLVN